MRRARFSLCVLCVLCGGELLGGTQPTANLSLLSILNKPVPLRDGIGRASEPVTTSSTRAQAFYDQGLSYLHSFVWIEAARSFNEALRADSNLAMAHLGLSYALGELGLSEQAQDASRRAESLAQPATDREKSRIAVRASQLAAAARPSDTALRSAYRARLDRIATAYPNDVEVLLLVGQAQDPIDDHGMSVGKGSLPYYERALARAPDYFAVHHFLAHAYENTGQINDALAHAERYARTADAVSHAHHMYGHVLRRVGRMSEAVAQFEQADRLAETFLKAEGIPLEYDWHYRHNLNLLGTAYQYRGQMKAAEAILRRSFDLQSIDRSEQELNRKDWLMFLLARNRPDEALTSARLLADAPTPLVRALGHIFASRALSARHESTTAADQGNAALRQMRDGGPRGGILVPEYQLAQGEFLLRSGQLASGGSMVRDAIAKLREQSGPDAWMQTLFSLEDACRVVREVGEWMLAAELADGMIAYDAGYAGSQYARALAAEHNGNQSAARASFDEAIKRWADADSSLPERQDALRRRDSR